MEKNILLTLLLLFLSIKGLSSSTPTFILAPETGYTSRMKTDPTHNDGGTYYRQGNKITYTWSHNGYTYSLWMEYYGGYDHMQHVYRRNGRSQSEWSGFIYNDPFYQALNSLAQILSKIARQEGVSRTSLALSFVQAMPYDDRNHHIQRYAVETLIDCRGDCSDTSMLYAGILSAFGIGCVLIEVPSKNHMTVGIWSNDDGIFVRCFGRKFLFCETTSAGWEIGSMPDDYVGVNTIIHKVNCY